MVTCERYEKNRRKFYKMIENGVELEPHKASDGDVAKCVGGCKDGDCEYCSPSGLCFCPRYCYSQGY